MQRRNFYRLATLVAVIILVQQAAGWMEKPQYLTQLTMAAYYSLAILGLTVLMGYTGQISIGHAGFFALGGYVSAFLTTYNLHVLSDRGWVRMLLAVHLLAPGRDLFDSETLFIKPWPACIVAMLLTSMMAYLIGKPVLKLKGHYLAMATLGFGTIVYKVVLGTGWLGAADGISEVPSFRLLPGLEISGRSALRLPNYYIAWSFVVMTLTILLNLIHSRVGRSLRAIHGAEDAASATGIHIQREKLKVFVLSAVLAALGGALLTHYNSGIGPSEASIMKSVRYVAIVAIGGMANLWGALTLGVILNFLSLRGTFGSYDDAVFGFILVAIMLFAPEGVLRAPWVTWPLRFVPALFRRQKGMPS